MNWQALGAIGELVGALAVVVSIIYLAIQIRLNSKLLQSAAQDSISLKYAQTMNMSGASPENAAIFHKGLLDTRSLRPEETTHFLLMMANTFIQMDYSHLLYLEGNISRERWETLFQSIQHYMSLPGGRFYWKVQGRNIIHGKRSKFFELVEAEYQKYADQES